MTKRRPPPKRLSARMQDERRVVRLLTEGRLTEVEYFAKWATEFRNQISVEFDSFHGSPMSLVKRAVELIEDRRRRGSDVAFDEIWCIFDRADLERRIVADLVGPADGSHETVFRRVRDRYLVGMLAPKDTVWDEPELIGDDSFQCRSSNSRNVVITYISVLQLKATLKSKTPNMSLIR